VRWSPRRYAIDAVCMQSMSGRRLLELRDCGEARPYVLGHAAHQLAMDMISTVTREGQRVRSGLSRIELELVAWLGCVELGFKMPGLAVTHDGIAELMRVSKRTVGSVTRRLSAIGVIEILPQHAPRDDHQCEGAQCRKGKHVRLWNVYRLSGQVRELLAAERHAKRGGHRPAILSTAPASAAQRADLLATFTSEAAPLASLRSGKKIQGEESKGSNEPLSDVSPVGEQVDRAPEGVRRRLGADCALAAVLARQERERADHEQQVRVEADARVAAAVASVPARVARALAAAEAGDTPAAFPELAELVRRGFARDHADARELVALVDERPLVPCSPAAARVGLCCPVHAVRAALRSSS
jgi:hypothetical protein